MLERFSKKESNTATVAPVPQKKTKTKEELAQLRKDMMKKRPMTAKPDLATEKLKPEKLHPKQALMERLASGKRVEVSEKAMHKLTSKNYNELPEVRQKREAEAKKMEMARRMAAAKEADAKRRKRLMSAKK